MEKIKFGWFRFLLGIALAGAFAPHAHAAADAPDKLSQRVQHNGKTIVLRLIKVPLRSSNFEVLAQNDTGGFDTFAPVGERSYIGSVEGRPAAVASGILKDDGVFWGAVYFDRGEVTIHTEGDAVIYVRNFGSPKTYGLPEYTVEPGVIGELTYGFDVGIDMRHDFFVEDCGGDIVTALEGIEFSVVTTRALYLQNVQLMPWLGRVIIRASEARDPFVGMNKKDFTTALHLEWRDNQQDSNYDMVAGLDAIGGGLAHPQVTANSSTYGCYFGAVWRHEMAHSWGLGHYDGGSPEGQTINSGNKYSRMSGPEVHKILRRRDHDENHKAIIDPLGVFTGIDIPPYAAIDKAVLPAQTRWVNIDVMANDHDINDTAGLTIRSFDSQSHAGGRVSMVGRGPGAVLKYSRPVNGFGGTDWFRYKIKDSAGQTATGVATVEVVGGTVSTFIGGDLQNSANWSNGFQANMAGVIASSGSGVHNWNVASFGTTTFNHTAGKLTGKNHNLHGNPAVTWNMTGGSVDVDTSFNANGYTVNFSAGVVSAEALWACNGGMFNMTGGTYTAKRSSGSAIKLRGSESVFFLMGGSADLSNAAKAAFEFAPGATESLLRIGGDFSASAGGSSELVVNGGKASTIIDPDWTGSISRDGYTVDDWMGQLTNANTYVGGEWGTLHTNKLIMSRFGYPFNMRFSSRSVVGGIRVTAENFTDLFAVARAGRSRSTLSRTTKTSPPLAGGPRRRK